MPKKPPRKPKKNKLTKQPINPITFTIMKRILTLCAVLLIAATAVAQTGAKRYGIKSGSYKTEMDMMGQAIVQTTFFDDYGAKEVTEMDMMGMQMTQLTRDGKTYFINKGDKSVQEMPGRESINFLNLTDEVIAKNKIKEAGKETVAGKECTVYNLEGNQMGQTVKMTVSTWNGFAMKTVINSDFGAFTTKVTEIKEGPVDAAKFEIPKF